MRIALIGAGAIGTILGALISEGGEDIELVDTYQEHVAALAQNGATIEGLNQRSALGYSSYAARKVQKTPTTPTTPTTAT